MNDVQLLIAVAAMVMVPLMAIVGFFLKIMRDGAARRVQDRTDRATHERIEERLDSIEKDVAGAREDIAWLKGKQNGKH